MTEEDSAASVGEIEPEGDAFRVDLPEAECRCGGAYSVGMSDIVLSATSRPDSSSSSALATTPSGHDWERTRRMGINTLAYRLPQHRTFFDLDADCVGITRDIPWSLNAQWLDLLARSGTALFLSPAPDAIGPEQKAAIRTAIAMAAGSHSPSGPNDWLTQTTPEDWHFGSGPRKYSWSAQDGASPFPI